MIKLPSGLLNSKPRAEILQTMGQIHGLPTGPVRQVSQASKGADNIDALTKQRQASEGRADDLRSCVGAGCPAIALTSAVGVFQFLISSIVPGAISIDASAVVDNEALAPDWQLRLLWIRVFTAITLTPKSWQRLPLTGQARITATVTLDILRELIHVPGVTVNFKVSWYPSSAGRAAAAAAVPAATAAVQAAEPAAAEPVAVLNPKPLFAICTSDHLFGEGQDCHWLC